MLTVVKIGGAWLEQGPAASSFRDLADLPGQLVVVHGGGKEISRWMERTGLPIEWRDGLRVTRGDSLQLTAMALSGWVNKRVVESLDRAGRPALGISGEDGGLLRADPLDPERFGEVGRVVSVDARPLRAILAGGFTPVVSPLSRGAVGRPLNVNADEAAIRIATAVRANRLLLLSDVPGVLAQGALVPSLDRATAAGMVETGSLVGGMRVKVEQALEAAEAGVEVRIGDEGLLHGEGGTHILAPEGTPETSGAGA
jgi:acetylglutamate kinase